MDFTILGPSDGQLADNKSDMTDCRFGGIREHSDVADTKDYTKRTGGAPNKEENPVDEVAKDVDEMTESEARKREFSRREETSNVQKNNEADWQVKSDSDNQPLENTDAFEPDPSDPNFLMKTRRSKLKGHFGDGQYDNPHGAYEGEIS